MRKVKARMGLIREIPSHDDRVIKYGLLVTVAYSTYTNTGIASANPVRRNLVPVLTGTINLCPEADLQAQPLRRSSRDPLHLYVHTAIRYVTDLTAGRHLYLVF